MGFYTEITKNHSHKLLLQERFLVLVLLQFQILPIVYSPSRPFIVLFYIISFGYASVQLVSFAATLEIYKILHNYDSSIEELVPLSYFHLLTLIILAVVRLAMILY